MDRVKIFRMGSHAGPPETGRKEAVVVYLTDSQRIEYQKPPRKSKEEQGREAWAYLHTSLEDPDVVVRRFEAMIPGFGCDCRKDYEEIKQRHPFDRSSLDAFFVSTVAIHNAVNQKLAAAGDTTKRVVSLEEARQIWNRPAPTDRA